MSTRLTSGKGNEVSLAFALSLIVPVFAVLGILWWISPDDMRVTSLSIAEAKAHGTYVARVVQDGGAPVILHDGKVERLWHIEGRFTPRRILDEGYTTSVSPDFTRIGSQRVRLYVQASDTTKEGCCLIMTRAKPTTAWLVLRYDDPAHRDTVRLRFAP